jgi:hypothetical protein
MKWACVALFLCAALRVNALDREAFTFTKYDLDVRIEPEQQRLGVRGRITLRNDSDSSQRSVSLQISSSLNWSAIKYQNQAVEFVTQQYISDIDHTGALSEAIVVLPKAVAPKQSVELEIGYEGIIQQDATRLTRIGVPEDQAKHAEWDQIGRNFTAVRGIGYVAWYPVAMEAVSASEGAALPDAVARWKQRETGTEMRVTFHNSNSSGMQIPLISDALAIRTSSEQMGRAYVGTMQCVFDHLNSTVPLFVIANFAALVRPAVNISYLPEHKAGADDYAAALDEVTPLVTKWFGDHRQGTETKAEVVDLPDANAASYEAGNMLLMPLSGTDTKLLLAAAQQITHLLFPSPQAWIRNGLANYAQVRLIEEKEGRPAAIAYLQAHLGALLDLEKQAAEKKSDGSLLSEADQFQVETKAMFIWWMLRDMAGESAFTTALINYKVTDDNDPAYMQKLMEKVSQRDLQWFFDDWVYHDRGLPDFRITSVFPNPLPSGGYLVTVSVENLGTAGAEVPVTLHGERESVQRLLVPAKSKASVRIETAAMPQSATVNDGSVPESDTRNNEYKIESLNH